MTDWIKPPGNALRLQIESDPAPGALVNLIRNPNGDLGGWGWITPVPGSTMSGNATPSLVYTSPGAVASYFYSESIRILPNQYAAASWNYDAASSQGFYRVCFEFVNAAGAVILTTGRTAYLNAAGTTSYGPFQAPANTTAIRLRFDHYSTNTGTAPTAGQTLRFSEATVVEADSNGRITASRANGIANPSFETNVVGFDSNTIFGAYDLATITQSSTRARFGTKSAKIVLPGSPDKASWCGWNVVGLTIGKRYTFSCYVYAEAGSPPVRADGIFLTQSDWVYTQEQWVRLSVTFTATQTNAFVGPGTRFMGADSNVGTYYVDGGLFEAGTGVGDYFDGSTPANPALGWSYAWTGTAQNSTSTATIDRPLGTTRTNLLPNPSFGVDIASWSNGSTPVALARDASTSADRPGSLKMTNTNTRTDIIQVPTTVTTYRYNLAKNPDFTTNTVGWTGGAGGVPDSAYTVSSGGGYMRVGLNQNLGGAYGGIYASTVASARTPVTPGRTYVIAADVTVSALFGANLVTLWGVFYDAAGNQLGSAALKGQIGGITANVWVRTNATSAVAPANAASIGMDLYFETVPWREINLKAVGYIKQILIEEAATPGPWFDGSSPNTSSGGVVKTHAWTGAANNSISQQRTDTTTNVPTPVVTPIESGPDSGAYSDRVPVIGGRSYTASAYAVGNGGAAARAVTLLLWWFTNAGEQIAAQRFVVGNTSAAWQRFSVAGISAPASAGQVRVCVLIPNMAPQSAYNVDAVQLEQTDVLGAYFDGDTPAASGWVYTWTGAPGASPSVAASANIPYVPPLAFLDILGPTHDIVVTREALNVGTLTANIVDAALDPATSQLIRPGRRVRLEARTDDWLPVFTGHVTHASVDYDLSLPEASKRARIELTAVDAVQELGNQNRSKGVATIAELPAVLAGCGVPWNVNGSGSQVGIVPVYVANNESASALDQVAITRDSNLGYAWVDRLGVLQIWDRAKISTALAGPAMYEATYKDVGISYNTDDLINEVNLTFLRYNPSTTETEEVGYGPYRNEQSITDWGVHSAMFTIQGIAENTTSMAAFAQGVLDANSVPKIRLNTMDLSVRLTANAAGAYVVDAASWWTWADLYDLVSVTCQRASINAEQSRITSIRHSISAPDSKWNVELGFADLTTVAFPSTIPSPTAGTDGTTVSELLRPVGEVTMFYGTKAQIPAGWLAMDGTSYSSTTYPKLYAMLGTTTLPNMTDRLPIGAGTKALGTIGGDPAKTLAVANMPSHNHGGITGNDSPDHAHQEAAAMRYASPNGNAGYPAGTAMIGNQVVQTYGANARHQHSISAQGSGTAFDVMNPWRALWFIIRAT